MLDKPRAVRQVHRVLRVGGVFICLTPPNGGYCWYRHLGPRLGLDTRHLSTDRFLTAREVEALIGGAGLGSSASSTGGSFPAAIFRSAGATSFGRWPGSEAI